MATAVTNDQVEKVVNEALISFGADADAIGPDVTFERIDVDSLDLAELAQIVEEQFGVVLTGNDVKDVKTVGDLVELIVGRA